MFDEAHHLPHVAREHASASASMKGSVELVGKSSILVRSRAQYR
ncbi:hypothetical protein ACT691_09115 [Vibrio metschnikovii]